MNFFIKYCMILAVCLISLTGCEEGNASKNEDNHKRTIIPEGKPYYISHNKTEKTTKALKVGWLEKICVSDINFPFLAKLDTGALTSSINAKIIKKFKRDDKSFVLYRLMDDNKQSDVFESEITRYTRIKNKTGEEGLIRRPVVMMTFKIGNREVQEEVNLADRGHFNYSVLIGRNMLAGNFAVDALHIKTLKTKCSKI